MSSLNGSEVPDLGAIRARQQAKAAIPPYSAGTPEFTTQIVAPLDHNRPNFTDAVDGAVLQWTNDGWDIDSIVSCALAGIDAQRGIAVFQVTARVSQKGAI